MFIHTFERTVCLIFLSLQATRNNVLALKTGRKVIGFHEDFSKVFSAGLVERCKETPHGGYRDWDPWGRKFHDGTIVCAQHRDEKWYKFEVGRSNNFFRIVTHPSRNQQLLLNRSDIIRSVTGTVPSSAIIFIPAADIPPILARHISVIPISTSTGKWLKKPSQRRTRHYWWSTCKRGSVGGFFAFKKPRPHADWQSGIHQICFIGISSSETDFFGEKSRERRECDTGVPKNNPCTTRWTSVPRAISSVRTELIMISLIMFGKSQQLKWPLPQR